MISLLPSGLEQLRDRLPIAKVTSWAELANGSWVPLVDRQLRLLMPLKVSDIESLGELLPPVLALTSPRGPLDPRAFASAPTPYRVRMILATYDVEDPAFARKQAPDARFVALLERSGSAPVANFAQVLAATSHELALPLSLPLSPGAPRPTVPFTGTAAARLPPAPPTCPFTCRPSQVNPGSCTCPDGAAPPVTGGGGGSGSSAAARATTWLVVAGVGVGAAALGYLVTRR